MTEKSKDWAAGSNTQPVVEGVRETEQDPNKFDDDVTAEEDE